MGSAQFLLCLRVRAAHRAPTDARANERIHKTQFEKIAKAERELVLDWLNLALPNRIRMTKRRTAAKIITFQPPANLSDGNSGKPRSFGYGIKSRI